MQIGIETQCCKNRQVWRNRACGVHRCLHLSEITHRLDEKAIDTTSNKSVHLLLEKFLRPLKGQDAHRLHQVPARTDVTQDVDVLMLISHGACDFSGRTIEFNDSVLQSVHRQSRPAAAESIRGQ